MLHGYDKEQFSALEAVTRAQSIAFAPIIFKAAVSLKRLGILACLEQHKDGLTLQETAEKCGLSEYAVSVLLDLGLSTRLLLCADERYTLAKTGWFLLNDPMTAVNLDFTEDVCYRAMEHLPDSLKEGRPCGLQAFGDWPYDTIYPGLTKLPGRARDSWFAFDHFYSDNSFNAALKELTALQPRRVFDVGGNTGKFAASACHCSDSLQVTIVDLPEQIEAAKQNPALQEYIQSGRVQFKPLNVLEAEAFPNGSGVSLWWMSQFLDCFSKEQIVSILKKAHAAMDDAARLCILELFWDNQRFEAASLSLTASSLYFTVLANGCSRFYSSKVFVQLLSESGFEVESQKIIGLGHTLLICKKAVVK